MPWFADVLNVVSSVADKASGYVGGQKTVNIGNIAGDAGSIVGQVLNKTGNPTSVGTSQIGSAVSSAVDGFNKENPTLLNIAFSTILNYLKKYIWIVLIVVGFIVYLIFRKK